MAQPPPISTSSVEDPGGRLSDGPRRSARPAPLQYLADRNPASNLAPAWGTKERYQLINLLNYVASEYHVSIGGLFNPTLSEEAKAAQTARAHAKLAYAEKQIVPESGFLLGANLTVADLYFWIVTSWAPYLGLDLSPYPKVQAFFKRVSEDPRVVAGQAKMNGK